MPNNKLPVPRKPWRQLSTLENSRLKQARANWRRARQKRKFARLAAWVRGLRDKTGFGQQDFAIRLGVSCIQLRRWERAYGYWPSASNMGALKAMAKNNGYRRF